MSASKKDGLQPGLVVFRGGFLCTLHKSEGFKTESKPIQSKQEETDCFRFLQRATKRMSTKSMFGSEGPHVDAPQILMFPWRAKTLESVRMDMNMI